MLLNYKKLKPNFSLLRDFFVTSVIFFLFEVNMFKIVE